MSVVIESAGVTPARSDQNNLRKAAQGFEQILIKQMLEAAKLGQGDDELFGQNEQRGLLQDMQIQQISESLSASGGLGLADALMKQGQFSGN